MLSTCKTRYEAANIVHNILLNEKKEADESNWQPALELNDIYDCNKCLWHVAQVYVKGIIKPRSANVFGGKDILSEKEKEEILDRLWNESKRIKVSFKENNSNNQEIKYISYEEAFTYNSTNALFIDVRSLEEYEKKYRDINFINISYEEIYLNPYCLQQISYNKTIILRCKKGYLSTLTAKVLLDHGYKNLFVLV